VAGDPHGRPGFWTWKVEPQKPGKAQLLVLVEHAGTFDKQERIFNVEQFPKTIEIEVGFWQSVQEAIAGFSPSITAIAGALGGIAASVAAGLAWLRNRRKEPGKGDDDSHGLPAT
jgi:membrane associated rhomboid family serine protease